MSTAANLTHLGVPEPPARRGASLGRVVDPAPVVEPFLSVIGIDEEERGWQDFALCAETDPEAFFPEKGGSIRGAKRICSGCEVRAECLEYALANDERFGIWGGLSAQERLLLRRGSSANRLSWVVP